ncbi:MAG: TRAP transporter substrate-binding protein [Burkholderiales bacterium]|nr:TRAP transporter substrate-binding protein [Burkholderiales bacterium]
MHKLAHVLAAAAAASLAIAGPAAAETWKMQSLWQAGSVNQKVFERFAENVAKASSGRLKIEPLPVKAVVAHNETLEAVGSGVLDGQQSAPVYFAGRDPSFGLIGDLNAAYENPYQMHMWFEYKGGNALARELYRKHNMYFIGGLWWGVESMPLKKPVRTLADFKGIKLRMPEGPASDIFRRIGAAPVNIPGSEVYTSLERGVIDGTDWGTLGMNEDLGYHKIAKFPIYPGIHSMPTGDVAVNLDKWNKLPEDLKVLLAIAVRDFARDMIQSMAVQDASAEQKARKANVELVDWSAEERKKLRAVAASVWKDYGAKNELAGRIYASQVAWLKELGLLD